MSKSQPQLPSRSPSPWPYNTSRGEDAELVFIATQAFRDRNYSDAVDTLKRLSALRSHRDPRVLHNLAVAEYYVGKDGRSESNDDGRGSMNTGCEGEIMGEGKQNGSISSLLESINRVLGSLSSSSPVTHSSDVGAGEGLSVAGQDVINNTYGPTLSSSSTTSASSTLGSVTPKGSARSSPSRSQTPTPQQQKQHRDPLLAIDDDVCGSGEDDDGPLPPLPPPPVSDTAVAVYNKAVVFFNTHRYREAQMLLEPLVVSHASKSSGGIGVSGGSGTGGGWNPGSAVGGGRNINIQKIGTAENDMDRLDDVVLIRMALLLADIYLALGFPGPTQEMVVIIEDKLESLVSPTFPSLFLPPVSVSGPSAGGALSASSSLISRQTSVDTLGRSRRDSGEDEVGEITRRKTANADILSVGSVKRQLSTSRSTQRSVSVEGSDTGGEASGGEDFTISRLTPSPDRWDRLDNNVGRRSVSRGRKPSEDWLSAGSGRSAASTPTPGISSAAIPDVSDVPIFDPTSIRTTLGLIKARIHLMENSLKHAKREIKSFTEGRQVDTDTPSEFPAAAPKDDGVAPCSVDVIRPNLTAYSLRAHFEYLRLNYRKAFKRLNDARRQQQMQVSQLRSKMDDSNSLAHNEKKVEGQRQQMIQLEQHQFYDKYYYNNLGCLHFHERKYMASALFFSKALQVNQAHLDYMARESGSSVDGPLGDTSSSLLANLFDVSPVITYNVGLQFLLARKFDIAYRCFKNVVHGFERQQLLLQQQSRNTAARGAGNSDDGGHEERKGPDGAVSLVGTMLAVPAALAWLRLGECCIGAHVAKKQDGNYRKPIVEVGHHRVGVIHFHRSPTSISSSTAALSGSTPWNQLYKAPEEDDNSDFRKPSLKYAEQCFRKCLSSLGSMRREHEALKDQEKTQGSGGNSRKSSMQSDKQPPLQSQQDRQHTHTHTSHRLHSADVRAIRSAALVGWSYVSLEMGKPVVALAMARQVLVGNRLGERAAHHHHHHHHHHHRHSVGASSGAANGKKRRKSFGKTRSGSAGSTSYISAGGDDGDVSMVEDGPSKGVDVSGGDVLQTGAKREGCFEELRESWFLETRSLAYLYASQALALLQNPKEAAQLLSAMETDLRDPISWLRSTSSGATTPDERSITSTSSSIVNSSAILSKNSFSSFSSTTSSLSMVSSTSTLDEHSSVVSPGPELGAGQRIPDGIVGLTKLARANVLCIDAVLSSESTADLPAHLLADTARDEGLAEAEKLLLEYLTAEAPEDEEEHERTQRAEVLKEDRRRLYWREATGLLSWVRLARGQRSKSLEVMTGNIVK
ncbi:hypothetical protein HK102_001693 [Quaeritorhiza haematococci]|nr:hypothetical protein HK102_001693 [Quaeritorhiza haematococci]